MIRIWFNEKPGFMARFSVHNQTDTELSVICPRTAYKQITLPNYGDMNKSKTTENNKCRSPLGISRGMCGGAAGIPGLLLPLESAKA